MKLNNYGDLNEQIFKTAHRPSKPFYQAALSDCHSRCQAGLVYRPFICLRAVHMVVHDRCFCHDTGNVMMVQIGRAHV